MRVLLDAARCTGHGRCYSLAPALFDSDDEGHCVLLVDEVPDGMDADAWLAVDNCPETALAIEP